MARCFAQRTLCDHVVLFHSVPTNLYLVCHYHSSSSSHDQTGCTVKSKVLDPKSHVVRPSGSPDQELSESSGSAGRVFLPELRPPPPLTLCWERGERLFEPDDDGLVAVGDDGKETVPPPFWRLS